jgi:hypothetical protein
MEKERDSSQSPKNVAFQAKRFCFFEQMCSQSAESEQKRKNEEPLLS